MNKKPTMQSPPVLAVSLYSAWVIRGKIHLDPFADNELCSSCGNPAYGWVLPSPEDIASRPSRKCKHCFQISILKAALEGKKFEEESNE